LKNDELLLVSNKVIGCWNILTTEKLEEEEA
jgi:hypothetical protein